MSKARGLADLGNAYSDGALSNRNLIINGAMQVAQRGTSSTSSGYQVLDRIFINHSGGAATVSQEEATFGNEVVGEFKNWMKFDCTTGDNYCGFQTRLEDVRSLRQGKATFSFYAKGTNPNSGRFAVGLQRLPAGASGATLDTPLNSTVTITSTWTRYTFTFDVPALGTSVTENTNSQLYLYISQESTDTSTDAWELNITGVQLEAGDTATPFEHRSFGDELARCQRYYQKSYNINTAPGTSLASGYITNRYGGGIITNRPVNVRYPTIMRGNPSVTLYSKVGTAGKVSHMGTSYVTGVDVTATVASENVSGFSDITLGSGKNEMISFHYTAEAEL